MFEKLEWQDDRMTLDGLVFRLEHHRRDEWNGGDHFRFFKVKGLIDAYEDFFRAHPIDARRVLELGMWDGGSLALWFEAFAPAKLVGVDIEQRGDSDYFRRYVAARGLHERIKTHWRTDQADAAALRAIVAREFDGPLDLVLDDASHLYAPTKASFETLFPLLRPGGLYVIEDWAWQHWDWFTPGPEWRNHEPLTRLAHELIEAAGTGDGSVAGVSVRPSFIVVERGPRELTGRFRLEDHIFRRKRASLPRRMYDRVVWGPEREVLFKLKQRLLNRR